MLILVKMSDEQRNSRSEALIGKKNTASKMGNVVFELKMNSAKATYEAEKTQAILQIVSGCVKIVTAGITMVGAIAGAGTIMNAVCQMISTLLNAAFQIVSGIIMLSVIAEKTKEAGHEDADADRMKSLATFNLTQVKNLQEAYNASTRDIKTIFASMREVLQQKQDTKMAIVRNI
jgi:hypothetical protein